MGLFSAIGNLAKGVLQGAETFVQHPIATTTDLVTGNSTALKDLYTTTNAAPLGNQIGNILKTTGAAAVATVAAGAALGSATAAGIVAKAATLIPTTGKGKIIAAVAAIPVTTAVLNNPIATVTGLAKTGTGLANFGSNAGELIANPSLSNAKTLLTENPVISTLVGGAAVAAIGGGIGLAANTIATFTNSQATKANTAATTGGDLPTDSTALPTSNGVIATNQGYPQLANTSTISTGTTKRRKKISKKAILPSINQRVNVIVQNKNSGTTTKNYLKREVLYN